MLYLNEDQVVGLLNNVGKTDDEEVIVVRCVRKGKASKPGGPDKGDLYDLHCAKKPPYTPKTGTDRRSEDHSNGVLTVWVTNRKTGDEIGAWRRVNVREVQKVIMPDATEYEVVKS